MAFLKNFLINNRFANKVVNRNFKRKFSNSALYWEHRYANEGNSGMGSYGDLAIYKAKILNQFVADNGIETVIEFGCGDGHQLGLMKFPSYVGLDVSVTAIEKCSALFKDDATKSFFMYNQTGFIDYLHFFTAELAISLDVIYHLVEDEVYEYYMDQLFAAASKFVIIYAWDEEGEKKGHVRHRKFSTWIADKKKDWSLLQKIDNKEFASCDFFIYKNEPNL
jgi:hypothetical protein